MEIVLPSAANHYGTLFGPNALSLLGRAAFFAATRFCGQSIVMAAANTVEFFAPIPVGALLDVRAQVIHVGCSSLRVRVRALRTDTTVLALRGEFTLVAVDASGHPTEVAATLEFDDAACVCPV
jgi:acyl-CoA hydrolase